MTKRTAKKPERWRSHQWFPCFAAPLRESYAGLDDREFRVGMILLLLSYELDGPLVGSERYLAGLCDLGPAAFRNTVRSLVAKGKLTIGADGSITHKHCAEVLELRRRWLGGVEETVAPETPSSPEIHHEFHHENNIKTGSFSAEKPQEYKETAAHTLNSKDSSEEDKSSSGAAASPPTPPVSDSRDFDPVRPGDFWTVCAQLLEPHHPGWLAPERSAERKAARDAGVSQITTVRKRLRGEVGIERAEIILNEALEAMTRHASPSISYLQGTATGLLADYRRRTAEESAAAKPRNEPFRIIVEGGRKWRINKATGERVEIAPAPAGAAA